MRLMGKESVCGIGLAILVVALFLPAISAGAEPDLQPGDILVADVGTSAANASIIRVRPDMETGAVSRVTVGTMENGPPIDVPRWPAVTSDGRVYYFEHLTPSRRIIRVINPLGWRADATVAPVGAGEDSEIFGMVWDGSSGSLLLADGGTGADDSGILRIDLDPVTGEQTGEQSYVTRGNDPGMGAPIDLPKWPAAAPDGAIYYLEASRSATAYHCVVRVDPSDGLRTVVSGPVGAGGDSEILGMVWDGTSGSLLVADGGTGADDSGIIRIDPATGSQSYVTGNGTGSGDPIDLPRWPAVAPDGTIYYLETSNQTVTRLDPSTGERKTLPGGVIGAAGPGQVKGMVCVPRLPTSVRSIVGSVAVPTNSATVSWTVVFQDPVTGLGTSHFALASDGLDGPSILAVTGSGATWTVTASTGAGDGTLGLNLVTDEGIISRSVSNLPFEGAIHTIDKTAPEAPILVLPDGPVTINAAEYTITGSAEPESLVNIWRDKNGNGQVDEDDSFAGNQLLPSDAADPTKFSITVALVRNKENHLLVSARDIAKNRGPASVAAPITEDSARPGVDLGTPGPLPDPTNATSIPLTITFTEPVSGLRAESISVMNAVISNLVPADGTSYTADLIPTADGVVIAGIPEGAALDAAGNGNQASNELSTTFDSTPPQPSLRTSVVSPITASPIPVSVNLDEPVEGLTASDIVVENGTTSDFGGSGASYSVNVFPETAGTVTVMVGPGAARDLAGNESVSSQLTLEYQGGPPTISGAVPVPEITDKMVTRPFPGIRIEDAERSQMQSVTVALDTPAKGSFTPISLSRSGFQATDEPGVYTFQGNAAQATRALKKLYFRPAENRVAPGSTETTAFTIKVSDGVYVDQDSTSVVSRSENDPPSISRISGQQTDEDTPIAIGLHVEDVDSPPDKLTITAGCEDNPTLVPDGSIALEGSGPDRTMLINPAADQNGIATIKVTVNDGEATSFKDVRLRVTPVNDAPAISEISARETDEDTPITVAFTVGDVDSRASNLGVTAKASNSALLPPENLVCAGKRADRTVTLSPVKDKSGKTKVTLTVSDGDLDYSEDFMLIVRPVNDPPTISGIPDQVMEVGKDTSITIPFAVRDVETRSTNLTVTGESGNKALLPNENIKLSGKRAGRTVTLTPRGGKTGKTKVILTVRDGLDGTAKSAKEELVLTVSAAAPSSQDEEPLTASAGPDQTASQGALVTLDGSNSFARSHGLFSCLWEQTGGPPVTLSDPEAVQPVFIAPEAGSQGISTVFRLSVNDGEGLTAEDVCIVNVPRHNRPPAADAGPDWTVTEGEWVRLHAGRSHDPDDGIASFHWEQTSGPVVELSDPFSPEPAFGAPLVGENGETLVFRLMVQDRGGLHSQDICIVNVARANRPPVARAGGDQTARAGESVELDGSRSHDPDGQTVTYRWSQTAGPPVTLSDPSAPQPSFIAPATSEANRSMAFRLRVRDGGGLESQDACEVTISP